MYYTLLRLSFIMGVSLLASFENKIRAQSDTRYFSGKVIDGSTGEELIGALVRSRADSSKAVVTDIRGTFSLKLSQNDPAIVSVFFLGYDSHIVQLKEGAEQLIPLQPKEALLKEVEVLAQRPQEKGTQSLSQLSIDKQFLNRNSSISLGTAISKVDGVSFVSTGANIQLPVIHGLYGNRILVLNNGFKHGFQNWGNDHAPEINVAGADRVTVVKGAAGVRYGPDALGGAVIVENNQMPFNRKFYGLATSSFQTNGKGYGINVNAGQGFEKFSYYVGANYNRAGDRHAPDYILTNTGAKEYAFQAGARYRYNEFDIKFNYSLINQNFGILRSSIGSSGPALIRNFESARPSIIREFSYDINEPNQTAQHQIASLSANWNYSEKNFFTLRYARQFNERQEYDVRRNSHLPIFDLDLITDDVQLEWNHHTGERLEGAIGIQVLNQHNRNNPGTNVTPFIPNYRTRRLSAFLVETLQAGKGAIEGGFRYDFENNEVGGRDNRQNIFRDNFNFSNFTAALGYVHQVNRQVSFRSNIGSGWRPPNMAELFSFGQHEARAMFGLLRYEPDENHLITANRIVPLDESGVHPEQSFKFTNGLDVTTSYYQFNLTAYANYIGNFIFSRPIGVLGTARGPMPTFIIDQADALFMGVDLTFTRFFTPNLKGTFGTSYLWSKNVERNEPLINQPPINLNYTLSWSASNRWGLDVIEASLEPSYTFQQFQAPRFVSARDLIEGNVELTIFDPIFDFQEAPPGYFLLNMFIKAEKNRLGASVQINNSLNTRYRDYLNLMRYFADDLGRNIILSINYKF